MTEGAPTSIAIGWRLSSLSGWGVYGTNLALELLAMGRSPVALLAPHKLDLDAARAGALASIFERQAHLQDLLGKVGVLEFDFPVLHSLRGDFLPPLADQIANGATNIGVIFFENTAFSPEGLERARGYDLIVTGSTWNHNILLNLGLTNVANVFQGIDTDLFKPQPKAETYGERFVIFSGGKLEYRKAQDVVIAAFKDFHSRHPDALLVFAWGNQWPGIMPTIEISEFIEGAPIVADDNSMEIGPWLQANGVAADDFVDLGMPANRNMPEILAAADAAIFANRCEPGTNLVAMETLAAGVPTIIALNTGQLDIAGGDAGAPAHCYPLTQQTPVKPYPPYSATQGWMEPSLREVIERLEEIYADREEAKRRGQAAAAFMKRFNWPGQIEKLMEVVDGVVAAR
ncbi:MAG: hypothetical protein HQ503_15855 [Rhodospirillales bacterium]|nr:hypothetical protein [Rhodospirillales bacterium]